MEGLPSYSMTPKLTILTFFELTGLEGLLPSVLVGVEGLLFVLTDEVGRLLKLGLKILENRKNFTL
jgi:hypothetical protein